MAIFRNGMNLSKLSDSQLKRIEKAMGVSGDQVTEIAADWQGSPSRMTVIRAAVAISLAEVVWGTVTIIEPSEESKAWDSFGGGHRFYQAPENMTQIIESRL